MMSRGAKLCAVSVVSLAVLACVPVDEAMPLGSVGFSLDATSATKSGLPASALGDGWRIEVEQTTVGFKTMTVGMVEDPDRCAYRGRGAQSDLVYDPRVGLEQIFNGLLPNECPDVGVVLGPPGGATTLGEGVSSSALLDLATGSPAHAFVAFRARRGALAYRVALRFDTERTPTRFGGCRDLRRGVRIAARERQRARVPFDVEPFLRETFNPTSTLRFGPYVAADLAGDDDHLVTFDELDALSLSSVRAQFSEFYQLPETRRGSFGDFIREQFKYVFRFRDEGQCFGNSVEANAQ